MNLKDSIRHILLIFHFSLFIFHYSFLFAQKPELVVPVGHTGAVMAVCFSPDGRYALSGSEDNTLKLWDVQLGKEVRSFKGHTFSVSSVCFSPDGRYALSGSGDSNLKLWDIQTGNEIHSFEGHWGIVESVCFSPDGRYALSGSNDNTLKLWDVQSGKEIRSFEGHSDDVRSVCFSPDGRFAFSGSWDGTLKLWDVQTGNEIRSIEAHTKYVNSVYFSPDGCCALSGSYDTLKLWDVQTGIELRSFAGHSPICISPDGHYALCVSTDNNLKLWDVQTGNEIRSFQGHTEDVLSVCFSPDSRFALSGSLDRTLKLWDVQTGNEIRSFGGHTKSVSSVCISPDNRFALFVSSDTTLKLWDFQTGIKICSFKGHTGEVESVCFSPNGRFALSGSWDYTLKLWDVQTGNEIRSFNGHKSIVNSVCFSPDGQFALSGSCDETLKLWDIQTGFEIRSFKGHNDFITSVCFSPDGRYALSGSWDKTVKLWDVQSGKEIRSFEGHTHWVETVSFSPDGRNALSGSYDNTIKLWDIQIGCEICSFKGHTFSVSSVCFSPDGNYALSGSYDHTLKLWDIQTGNEIRSFECFPSSHFSVNIFAEGRLAISGSADNTLKLWDIQTGEEVVTFISLDESEWMVKTPDQYYFASKNALKYLSFRLGSQLFSFDQFDLKYNRPDIVLERIGFAPKELIESYRKAYQKRLKKMGFTEDMLKEDFHVPEIKILNKDEINVQYTDQRPMTNDCRLNIKLWDTKYPLDRLNVWVNEVPVHGMAGIGLRPLNTDSTIQTIDVELSSGNNKIQVSALNQAGAESLKETVYVDYQPEVPDASTTYFVGIGVSNYKNSDFNLTYAVKDIQDMAGSFKQHDPYLVVDTLLDQNVTRENVLKLKNELLKTTVNDKVILAVSGHGFLSDSLDFYYGTWDIDPVKPELRGLAFDDIEWLLDSIPARKKLVFMDACHSGEVDKEEVQIIAKAPALADSVKEINGKKGIEMELNPGAIGLQNSFELMQELFTNLSKGNGASVISAAGGMQYAYEGDKWKNGVFSYAVMKGTSEGVADTNDDGEVTVNELQNYVMKEVEILTGGRQKPTARQENLEADWRVW